MNHSTYSKQVPCFYLRSSGIWGWLVLLFLLWAGSSPAMAGAVLFTFDDLPGDLTAIPNGYGGFRWNNFCALQAATTSPSGYAAGMISQPNVAYNGFGDPAQLSNGSPFDLYSGYFTGAWRDGLQLEVRGYIGPTLAYDNTYTLSATAPSLLNFDYFGVTSVDFTSSGGTHHPGYVPDGTQFAMDDLTLVPPVELSINKSGSNVIVSWSNGPGFILQAKSSLSPQTTWTNLGTQNPQTIPISAGARFFRVVSP